ncbi:MAG: nucleotide exchange factor GrpE [Crocinitomicaceae bacterium]|nr:nucleotide exchange factor GrpE [Crocinitomicaceae bacterium]
MSAKENKEEEVKPVDVNQSANESENKTEENQTDQNSDESADKKIAELNDKYLRLYSDFDNFRKRTMKEKVDVINSASADVLKDILVVLDDFERAVANNEKVEDINSLREGFKLIQHKLITILTGKGLVALESKGEQFDPDRHEAITNVPVADESQKGKVIDVVERGYNLHGKTLRFAKVIVGQ